MHDKVWPRGSRGTPKVRDCRADERAVGVGCVRASQRCDLRSPRARDCARREEASSRVLTARRPAPARGLPRSRRVRRVNARGWFTSGATPRPLAPAAFFWHAGRTSGVGSCGSSRQGEARGSGAGGLLPRGGCGILPISSRPGVEARSGPAARLDGIGRGPARGKFGARPASVSLRLWHGGGCCASRCLRHRGTRRGSLASLSCPPLCRRT